MSRKKEKQLRDRIREIERIRNIAFVGLFVGIVMVFLGLMFSFPVSSIAGYTVMIVSTVITSFSIVMKWMIGKDLRALATEKKEKMESSTRQRCPRCGAPLSGKTRFCQKCGKMAPRKPK